MPLSNSLSKHLSELTDPRIEKKCSHLLIDIVFIGICATIAGAEGWEEIEEFGKSKEKWLHQWLKLPSGIPSHDTIERVFMKLNASEFDRCFMAWTQDLVKDTDIQGEVVALDGKALRGTNTKLYLVSAWASAIGISLGQYKVDEKSNEITAIPELLDALMLSGSIVTIDAMGCQTAIAQKIVAHDADYVLAVKGNQGTLLEYIESRFAFSDDPRFRQHEQPLYYETVEQSHGRQEKRQCSVFTDPTIQNRGWEKAQTLIRVTAERTSKAKVENHTRYFISTLPADPAYLLQCIRAHWQIENSFHWVLDVVFKEDQHQTRHKQAAVNLSILRRIALNLLKRHPGKGSLKRKRYRAALNEDFLLEILHS
jgi:predicted transposase YbfD/YdcC